MMIVAAFLGLSIIVVVTAMPHSNDIDDLRFDSVESALKNNSLFWSFTESICSESSDRFVYVNRTLTKICCQFCDQITRI